MSDPATERAILITEDQLDRRIDFERGMRVVPRITLLLIAIQAALFAVQIALGALEDPGTLINLGAQESTATRRGEVWRLWSATMLHGSFDHFLGNALALYIMGMACEHAFGLRQYLFLYVASALAGSLLSLAGLPPGIPAVGASGAIFGLMGAVVAVIFRHRARLFVRDKRVGWVVLCWAAYTVLLGFMTPFVDNLAHIGGFIGGAAAGWFLRPRVLEPEAPAAFSERMLFVGSLAATVSLTVPWLLRLMPSRISN